MTPQQEQAGTERVRDAIAWLRSLNSCERPLTKGAAAVEDIILCLEADLQRITEELSLERHMVEGLRIDLLSARMARENAQDALRHVTEERQKLVAYAKHKVDCWLLFQTRDLVPTDGPSGIRFRREGDPEPTCTCGLFALLRPEAQEEEQKG